MTPLEENSDDVENREDRVTKLEETLATLTNCLVDSIKSQKKLTEDVSKFVTNPRPAKSTNLQNCPKIRKGENLETWLEEMKL